MRKMPSFAHMSDVHLGAFRHNTLKNLVLDSFRKAIDLCAERKVDFIVISGDLFDSNLPDLSVVKQAVAILRKAREKGINIYVIYGSHDFSPTQTSMMDIIEETGLIRKVT
ncbi:TPA: DNA repair exonuclease, partial [Candidatus Poribacteria bacterium]|nr:DNA repair exonuclease [Candidatus Poribacteria bacterium]HEX29172.1 DNA repair exonuclease [Candidatus Poribacteria bacterium]